VDDIKCNAVYQGGLEPDTAEVKLFWEALESFDQDKRGKVLQFITGTSKVPLDGYAPPFTITKATDIGPDALPKVCLEEGGGGGSSQRRHRNVFWLL